MVDDGEWIADANTAVTVSLVAPSEKGLRTIESFSPKFTHTIFGDDHEIFGYKDLQISLQYHASDMRPCVSISHGKKFKAVGETMPTDIEACLEPFLPEVAFQKPADFTNMVKQMRTDWTPPGELLEAFKSKGRVLEVWKASLAHPVVKQTVKRIQILVPFFIENGQYIDEDDGDSWTIFFLYERRPVPGRDGETIYVFAGYSTVHSFFFFQPASNARFDLSGLLTTSFDPSVFPCRTRISQFIILPPFQGQGLGPKLYSVIYEHYLKHEPTMELTVEDPNEEFDDLRDVADLRFLREQADFASLRINNDIKIDAKSNAPVNIVDKAACEAVRRKYKIAPRQFARVLEMHLMSQLPGTHSFPPESIDTKPEQDQHQHRLWKLLVKQRIYRKNKDILGQLELHDRIEKLDETLSSVEFDYARLLEKASVIDQHSLTVVGHGKRKLDDSEPSASKKMRMGDESGADVQRPAAGSSTLADRDGGE